MFHLCYKVPGSQTFDACLLWETCLRSCGIVSDSGLFAPFESLLLGRSSLRTSNGSHSEAVCAWGSSKSYRSPKCGCPLVLYGSLDIGIVSYYFVCSPMSSNSRSLPQSSPITELGKRGLNVCGSRANSMVTHKANGGWNLIMKRRLAAH